jgi:hypothetical protein
MLSPIRKISSHFIVSVLIILLIFPKTAYSSQMSGFLIYSPYPPPTDVVAVSDELEEPTFLKLYLPFIVKDFPPSPTDSFYIWTTQDMWGLGCSVGSNLNSIPGYQEGFVFLDFGLPNQDSQGRLGTVLYNSTPIANDNIASTVVVFANGFDYCAQNDAIIIAVGTNSSGGLVTDVIAYQHGQAWSNLIIEINNRFLDYPGLSSHITAVAGNNIEPNFNPEYIPRHWLDGYHSVADYRRTNVYIIGSADECPQDFPPSVLGSYTPRDCYMKYAGQTLLWKWTQEDVRNISWGYSLSWPFPEIYNSATANQWYRISLLSRFNFGNSLHFRGEITQSGACEQIPPCEGEDYQPKDGFWALYNRLQADQYTLQGNDLKWSTDIRHYYGP